jgi:hypothetical protein
MLAGVEWSVESCEPHLGRVLLRRPDGQALPITIRSLVNHSDCWSSTNRGEVPASGRGRQPAGLADLTSHQREMVATRFAHLMEVETGFRSGDPRKALPGEPRPGYDPASTTLTARRETKVAEVKAMPAEEARMLGLEQISVRSLKRWAADCRRFGIAGCIKGQWLRRGGERISITEPVREAIFAVRAETLHRSRVSMKSREMLIRQYVHERFGPDVVVPSYTTLRMVWREWFGSGGSRQRYARSAAALSSSAEPVVVHRPGQVVALDTTELAVLARENVFGEPSAVRLTLALDVYTHSLVAFRLTLVSDTAVDVAMLLRDVMMPLPMREDWGEDLEWPYPGLPAAVVAEFAGHRVAGLPFFAPETVTTDHGAVYKNHHLVEVQRVIGANILPARVLRPTDKHAVERAFAAIQSLLLELLPGYRGVDVADRGTDPQDDAVLTVTELEHLIATWIVSIWQNRALGGHAPAWDPGGRHSPNSLFAAAMSQGGFAMQIPSPELYYQLLPSHHVKIHGRRGVKIRGLWYDGDALDDYRDGPSNRGGAHKGKWVIRRDPRDRRFAYFQDPVTHQWRTLRWTGLAPEGEVPAFGDGRAAELLRVVKHSGLAPKSDAELLPLLLDLLGGRTPVDAWPTQMPKAKRIEHAREDLQGRAAGADRPHAATLGEPQMPAKAGTDTVVPLRRPERARQVVDAVDEERRRRREQVMGDRAISPPPRLGEGLRRNSLFLLPDDDSDAPAGGEPVNTDPAQDAR